jgi:hypothetical protein
VVLLLLVWGLTVPMRGMWQDDTLLLRLAHYFQGGGFLTALTPVNTPLRRLYTLPFRLALSTPQPIWTLHVLYGVTWLGMALVAGWIARLLLPGRRLTSFLAICLTLTASSDYLTDNLTSLGYNVAALLLLLAVGSCLRYAVGGSGWWLGMACVSAAASIWTVDVAFTALPFVPLLLVWRAGLAAWRRILGVLSAVALTLAPAVVMEWKFLHDPTGYAAVAMLPLTFGERFARAMSLWGENFAPWRWVAARPLWYARPAAVIPMWAMALAAGVAAGWFVLRARQIPNRERVESVNRSLLLVVIFTVMALAANAAYAGLQMAEIHYRTHIVSRVWASLAMAVLAGWLVQRWPRFRTVFLFVPLCFIGFGVWGGLERQDLWVSTWRMHQRELRSIVTAVPGKEPGTGIILRSRSTPDLYLATEADYLAQSWLQLLYDDRAIHALRLAPDRGTGCDATPQGLDCWHEGEATCFAARRCPADHFSYDTLVLLDFDERQGTWQLLADPRGDPLLGSGEALTRYRPTSRIVERPLTARQRALLLLR